MILNPYFRFFFLVCLLPACATFRGVIEDIFPVDDSGKPLIVKPSASLQGVSFKGLDLRGLDLQFDVEIENPYRIALPLVDLNIELSSESTPFLSGGLDAARTISAQSTGLVALPVRVGFRGLFDLLPQIKPGALVPFDANLEVVVDAPQLGEVKLPLSASGNLPVPSVPSIRIAELRWTELSWRSAAAELVLDISSDNHFPVAVTGLSYQFQLGGQPVAGGNVDESLSLAAREGRQLHIPVEVSPISLGLAAFKLFQGNEAPFSFQGNLGVGTDFGSFLSDFEYSGDVPLRRLLRK